MSKKIVGGVVFAVLLIGTLVGCSQGSQSGDSSKTDSSEQTTRVLTDAYGRTVELPQNVEKAATVGSAARFVVYAGAQDKLIAVTEMETKPSPSRPYTLAYESLFTQLPSTSNGNHLMETSVNSEELLSLHPDVIISSRSAAECDSLQERIGIPVVGISYQDQIFSEDVYTSIEVVGQALGTSEHADRVVSKMKTWEEDLAFRSSAAKDSSKPTVYVGAVNYKGAKSFGGTYAHYAPLEAVNGINVADETGQTGSVQIDLEQLGVWNPDCLFLNEGNKNLMEKDYRDNQAFFDSLSAFQSGNIYTQPSFNYNGTNVELGICDAYFMGFVLYPEVFSDINPAFMYEEVFETLLGTRYYETMKEQGMDFKKISFSS